MHQWLTATSSSTPGGTYVHHKAIRQPAVHQQNGRGAGCPRDMATLIASSTTLTYSSTTNLYNNSTLRDWTTTLPLIIRGMANMAICPLRRLRHVPLHLVDCIRRVECVRRTTCLRVDFDAPIKLSVPLPRANYYLVLQHPTFGGCAMQTNHTYYRIQASDISHAKARVAYYSRRILENSNPVAAQLTGWQGTETSGVRLTKRLSIRCRSDESCHRQ
jgi:hypothetical protein